MFFSFFNKCDITGSSQQPSHTTEHKAKHPSNTQTQHKGMGAKYSYTCTRMIIFILHAVLGSIIMLHYLQFLSYKIYQ